MDGVLADFDKKRQEVFGELPEGSQFGKIPDQLQDREMWATIHAKYPNWFLELEPMHDFELLWNYCKPMKPIVLTTLSRSNVYRITQQKIKWIHKNLGSDVPVIVCMRSHKKDYASTESILVDDHLDNIKQFQLHGGIGILHKSAALSIANLSLVI